MSWSESLCSVLIEQTFQAEEFCCLWLSASHGPAQWDAWWGNDMLSVRLVFSHLGVPAVRQSLSAKATGKSEEVRWGGLPSINTHTSLRPWQSFGVDIENEPNGEGCKSFSNVNPSFCFYYWEEMSNLETRRAFSKSLRPMFALWAISHLQSSGLGDKAKSAKLSLLLQNQRFVSSSQLLASAAFKRSL